MKIGEEKLQKRCGMIHRRAIQAREALALWMGKRKEL